MTEETTTETTETGASDASASSTEEATPTTPEPSHGFVGAPEFEVPEAYRSEDGNADVAKLIERATAADQSDAERTERRGDVPEDVHGYSLDISPDIKMPNGESVTLDAENPVLKEHLEGAHKAGLGQGEIKAQLESYARTVAAEAHAQQAAVNAEIGKLGENAVDRINGLTASLRSVGDADSATQLLNEITTSSSFEFLESLMVKLNGGDESVRVVTDAPASKLSRADRMYNKSA